MEPPGETSNNVAAQSEDIFAPGWRSDYLWAWGQFLDRDIDLTETTAEAEPIPIPAGDEFFDYSGTGMQSMPFIRSTYDATTGITGPRQQINTITGWIDASHVYGSDAVRAADLRTLDGTGRLRTSPGELLPFDPLAPGFFLAGDDRSNEQIALTALHTLFMREHNRLAALNIQRGRDHGLPTYTEARLAMGLGRAHSFVDVSSDVEIQRRLARAYDSVDDIDLWVGGLAEDRVGDSLVGELLYMILTEQFEALRDGDRFWYQTSLSPAELAMVESTSLADVIVRNTPIRRGEIQREVFYVTTKKRGNKRPPDEYRRP